MTETHIKKLLEKISKAKHKYCGNLDENGFRIRIGCEQWFKENYNQKYSGQFFYNNLQNKGVYSIDQKGDQTYYDGYFYNNKLEGYGKVVYADNKIFEGLFKNHVRFGPGVLTYSDGTQDVGIWNGFTLRRITIPVGDDFVPRLGRTTLGKAKLLPFKKLVPVCNKVHDRARTIFNELSTDEEVVTQCNELYNLHIRNQDSLFFNSNLFEDNFIKNDCTIDVVISEEEFENGSVEVEHIYSEQTSQSQVDDVSYCTCFQATVDKFGYICTQLHDVEVKLETLLLKEKRLEEQLNACKHCCKNMHLVVKDVDAANMMQPRELISILRVNESGVKKSNKSDSRKVLSFYSSGSDFRENESQNDIIRSEIELKNYFYTYSAMVTEDIEAEKNKLDETKQQETFSGVTLPFGQSGALPSDFSDGIGFTEMLDYDLQEEHFCEGNEIPLFVPEVSNCYCNAMLIENIDIVREKLKSLNQEKLFYKTVRNMLKEHLDLEFQKLTQLEREETRFVKKVVITDLLAWNNEDIWISTLQHCFRHRFSENNVSFNVTDLMTGHRHYFKNPAVHETNCRKFLEDCSEGYEKAAFNHLVVSHINPDLCDVRGNTGLMLAAIRDKINVIAMLVNCGAKLDVMNDEGLTPLTISFLKYISFKYKVYDWEKAFLQEINPVDIHLWRPTKSFPDVYSHLQKGNLQFRPKQKVVEDYQVNDQPVSLSVVTLKKEGSEHQRQHMSELSSKVMMISDDFQNDQTYLFNLEFIRAPKLENLFKKNIYKRKKKRKTNKRSKTKKLKSTEKGKKKLIKGENGKDKSELKDRDTSSVTDGKYKAKLDTIKKTIVTLLNYGSDPNIGTVPLQSIFLAIFTDDSDFMHSLLTNNANPNAVTVESNLTPLHVIVSLKLSSERVKMCDFLLKHKADPNIKTNIAHWSELREEVLGDYNNKPNEGKNVLHMLSLREDYNDDVDNFFDSIAKLLVFGGCNTSDFYMGHSPLSLAVLRGNIKLIRTLLLSKRVDPHQLLGNEMGNALTVLILNRFSSILSADEKKAVAQTLFENGFNPLNRVGAFENVIAFMENECDVTKLKGVLSKGISKENAIKKLHKTSKKSRTFSRKVAKKGQRDFHEQQLESLKNYITEVSRKILFRHLQSKAVYYLYIFMKEALLVDPLVIRLAKFITPDKALDVLQLLFQNRIIDPRQLCSSNICSFLKFIKMQHYFEEKKDHDECQKTMRLIKSKLWTIRDEDDESIYLPLPEVDKSTQKYEICFYCLKSDGKKLTKCPSCELVYFCSEECKLLDEKLGQYHSCGKTDNAIQNQEPGQYRGFLDIINNIAPHKYDQQGRLSIMLTLIQKIIGERKVELQLKQLTEKLSKLKFVTKEKRQEAAQLLQLLNKLKQEKEDFARTNNIDLSKMLFVHDHQYTEDVKLEVNISSNMLTIASSADSKARQAQQISSVLKFSSTLPSVKSMFSAQSSLSTDERKSRSKALTSQTNASRIRTNGSTLGSQSTSQNLQVSSTSQKSRILASKQVSMTRRSTTIPKQIDEDFILKLSQEPSDKTGESIDRFRKMSGKPYYTELLTKIFADFNLPLLLLPYACYKDGQVYYSMSGNTSSYFGSNFYKLNIPD